MLEGEQFCLLSKGMRHDLLLRDVIFMPRPTLEEHLRDGSIHKCNSRLSAYLVLLVHVALGLYDQSMRNSSTLRIGSTRCPRAWRSNI